MVRGKPFMGWSNFLGIGEMIIAFKGSKDIILGARIRLRSTDSKTLLYTSFIHQLFVKRYIPESLCKQNGIKII